MNSKSVGEQRTVLYIFGTRAVFLGHLDQVKQHRYASSTIVLGVNDSLKIRADKDSQWHSLRSAVVPLDHPHELDLAGNVLGVYFWEPELDFAFRQKYPELTDACFNGQLKREKNWLELSQYLFEQAPDAEEAKALIDKELELSDITEAMYKSPDPRVQKIIQISVDEALHNESVEALAERVNLSSSRLGHLFKEQTGITLTRFRSFNRMRAVAFNFADGCSLTDGAIAAGYSDSSHFNRTFKDLFGIPPSSVFNRSGDFILRITKS